MSVITQLSSIWSIDRTLSGPTTPSQNRPGRDDNERVLCIPQISSITEASSSNSLMSFTGSSLSYHYAEMQSVYFAAPADRDIYFLQYISYSKQKKKKQVLKNYLNAQNMSTLRLVIISYALKRRITRSVTVTLLDTIIKMTLPYFSLFEIGIKGRD